MAANILSEDSEATALAQQDAIITQTITGNAEATSEQTSDIDQSSVEPVDTDTASTDDAPQHGDRHHGPPTRPGDRGAAARHARPQASRRRATGRSRRHDTRDAVTTLVDAPTRVDGVQLIGEMVGSGYRTPPALVRRSDGQVLQLTPLLYLVLDAVDGRRSCAEIADTSAAASGRGVTEDDVRTLVDSQLRPLGLLRRADGAEPELKRSDPLLGLKSGSRSRTRGPPAG